MLWDYLWAVRCSLWWGGGDISWLVSKVASMLRGQEDGGGGLPQTSQTAQSPTNTQVEHTSLRLTLNGSQVSITSKNIQQCTTIVIKWWIWKEHCWWLWHFSSIKVRIWYEIKVGDQVDAGVSSMKPLSCFVGLGNRSARDKQPVIACPEVTRNKELCCYGI